MLGKQKTLNHAEIDRLFGSRSVIFNRGMNLIEKKRKSNAEKYERTFKAWKKAFKDIYGNAMNDRVFLKHTYFALLLKSLVIIELNIANNLDLEETFNDMHSNDLTALQFHEFDHFYWMDFDYKVFSQIYTQVEDIRYEREDLFQLVYQEMFIPDTRHKIGEYYTPEHLVKAMVDDTYSFGEKVLDPSCGSGGFLIEIICQILNSEQTVEQKMNAIGNVYGFDINPLAILTAKTNILLLFLEYFNVSKIPIVKLYLLNSLFIKDHAKGVLIDIEKHLGTFDLIIGNPPWLTYKDLNSKEYQKQILELNDELDIKPSSQYITHIDLAAVFFYAIPTKFLKHKGKIFFVLTKSVLNGDHCYKFRSFKIFSNIIEIWDFPKSYMFNIPHVCLKAEYIGSDNDLAIADRYPIDTKIFDDELNLIEQTHYSSIKINNVGAKVLLLERDLKILSKVSKSEYRPLFFQGATLVPRTLVFFQIEQKEDDYLKIASDADVITRSKKNWSHYFQNKKIENQFYFQSFLNKDLIPFFLTKKRKVFLPVTPELKFDEAYLKQFPLASRLYKEMNDIYKTRKKNTSKIETLFDNLNYWNKLTKQVKSKNFLTVYNASGSNIKAAVIPNHKRRLVVGSENYYFPTDSRDEAQYLSGILNSPILSRNMKLIKSSRHIHKRPFTFPIPLFDENNECHKEIARVALRCESISVDLFMKNPNINSEKVRIIMNQKLQVLNDLVKKVVFNGE